MLRRFVCCAVSLHSNACARCITQPAWISALRSAAKKTETNISYDVKIYDSLTWRKKKFTFGVDWNPASMSSITRKKLCLGDEGKEYTVIGEALPFPDREDSPVVNEPRKMCSLLWDHTSLTEKLFIQLSDDFPPLLWHAVKPTYEVVSRTLSEFMEIDVEHMKRYLPYYESTQNSIETALNEKLTDCLSPSYLKNKFIEDMRKRDPQTITFDYPKEHHIFLGTTPQFRLIEDYYMKSCPFVFGWPLLLSEGNDYIDETPLRMAAFRTVFSKSLLLFHTRMDLQIDHRQKRLSPEDEIEDIVLETPLFCTINYPLNKRLCGGSQLVERYNRVMGTSFPNDTPVDVLCTFSMQHVIKGEKELLEDLHFLTASSQKAPEVERVFRLSDEQIGCNRILGQLAYTIIYLALINYQYFEDRIFKEFCSHPSDLVRVACAKAAFLCQRPDLVSVLIMREKESRTKLMLQSTLEMFTSASASTPGEKV